MSTGSSKWLVGLSLFENVPMRADPKCGILSAEDEDEEDEELSSVVEQSKNEEKAVEELASDEEPNIIDEFLSDNIPKASPIQSQNINLANKTGNVLKEYNMIPTPQIKKTKFETPKSNIDKIFNLYKDISSSKVEKSSYAENFKYRKDCYGKTTNISNPSSKELTPSLKPKMHTAPFFVATTPSSIKQKVLDSVQKNTDFKPNDISTSNSAQQIVVRSLFQDLSKENMNKQVHTLDNLKENSSQHKTQTAIDNHNSMQEHLDFLKIHKENHKHAITPIKSLLDIKPIISPKKSTEVNKISEERIKKVSEPSNIVNSCNPSKENDKVPKWNSQLENMPKDQPKYVNTLDIGIKSQSMTDLVQNNNEDLKDKKAISSSESKLSADPIVHFKLPSIQKPPTKVIKVNNHPYEVHSLLGKGGSSKVYQVYDLKRRTFAIKHVKMSGVDIQIQNEYKNEIELLKSLQDQDFVIKMYDYEYKENEILVVLEKGETDFQLLLQKMEKNQQIDWITIKYFWSQMLRAVHSIHQAGIIHSDLKPANFMMVEGRLKLIDFGIASKIQQDATSVVKDSQMGTINYMSPDAIMEYTGITSSSSASSSDAPKYRITLKCDIWSLGCILYKMVYKNPPFAHIRGIYRQIGAITNSKHIITFPQLEDPDLIDVLKLCLNRNPKARPSTGELLRHPYLTHRVQPSLQDYLTGLPQLTPAQIQQVFEYSRKLLEKSAVR